MSLPSTGTLITLCCGFALALAPGKSAGSQAALARMPAVAGELAADAGASLELQPDADFNGILPAALTLRARNRTLDSDVAPATVAENGGRNRHIKPHHHPDERPARRQR